MAAPALPQAPYAIRTWNGAPDGLPLVVEARDQRDPGRLREWIAAERPLAPCDWHHVGEEGPITVLPPKYEAWGSARASDRVVTVRQRTPRAAKVTSPTSGEHLAIVSPADGSTYLIDPTLRREFQVLSLKATPSTSGQIAWGIDGRELGSTAPGTSLDWPLTPGRHRITARDSRGRTAAATITVR